MKRYELGFILRPVLSTEEKAEVFEKVKLFITKFEGVVIEAADWGKRELTYEIAKCKEGFYCFVKFTSPTEAIAKIENECRLADAIIRHIIVTDEIVEVKTPKKPRPPRKPRTDFKKPFVKRERTDRPPVRTDRPERPIERTERPVEIIEKVETETKEEQ